MSAIYSTTKNGLFRAAKRSGGLTLIEAILYLAILTFFMGVVVEVFLAMGGAYKNIKAARELELSGTIAMENLLREIRNASSVVLSQSSLNVSPGSLTLAGKDESTNPYTVAFTDPSGAVLVSKDGGTSERLTASSAAVSYLKFTRVTSANSEGVRVELQMSDGSGRSEKFYGFAVLRGSY